MLICVYSRFTSRPATSPYCQAGIIPFCPTGRAANTMPTFQPTDVVEVYALKAPVWEFKFGDLLAKMVSTKEIYPDNIGFAHWIVSVKACRFYCTILLSSYRKRRLSHCYSSQTAVSALWEYEQRTQQASDVKLQQASDVEFSPALS